jgi:hypothetical protein
MKYTVRCPHCQVVHTMSDTVLWPGSFLDEADRARYPDPSEPQKCPKCPGWMRIVHEDSENKGIEVEKCLGKPMEWVKTADRLPVHEQYVLAWISGFSHICEFHVLESSRGGGFFGAGEGLDPDAEDVSHWMPLPDPPAS